MVQQPARKPIAKHPIGRKVDTWEMSRSFRFCSVLLSWRKTSPCQLQSPRVRSKLSACFMGVPDKSIGQDDGFSTSRRERPPVCTVALRPQSMALIAESSANLCCSRQLPFRGSRSKKEAKLERRLRNAPRPMIGQACPVCSVVEYSSPSGVYGYGTSQADCTTRLVSKKAIALGGT